jgi:hypothetical protein
MFTIARLYEYISFVCSFVLLPTAPPIDQGENNMGGRKGNSLANTGYSCEQRELIRGWREVWSEVQGTTGIVLSIQHSTGIVLGLQV